jgi:hypothetical protein
MLNSMDKVVDAFVKFKAQEIIAVDTRSRYLGLIEEVSS